MLKNLSALSDEICSSNSSGNFFSSKPVPLCAAKVIRVPDPANDLFDEQSSSLASSGLFGLNHLKKPNKPGFFGFY